MSRKKQKNPSVEPSCHQSCQSLEFLCIVCLPCFSFTIAEYPPLTSGSSFRLLVNFIVGRSFVIQPTHFSVLAKSSHEILMSPSTTSAAMSCPTTCGFGYQMMSTEVDMGNVSPLFACGVITDVFLDMPRKTWTATCHLMRSRTFYIPLTITILPSGEKDYIADISRFLDQSSPRHQAHRGWTPGLYPTVETSVLGK